MELLKKYLPRIDFNSYEDFLTNYKLDAPDNFNFGFDCVDAWAELEPDKKALVWCDDHGGDKTFTFGEMKTLSNQAVHFLKARGIGKGDPVLLILRRRWEYWILAVALHKLGAVLIPASLQLTAKDIEYRVAAAGVKMLVCVDDNFVLEQVEKSGVAAARVIVPGPGSREPQKREGWAAFNLEGCSSEFPRPAGADATKSEDLMLMYFTSGTTGMPKMVMHNHLHPLGHIVTAQYWQQVQENKLHMSVSDSGWAKFGWGKIYGQWLCGAVVFAYDMDKFVPKKLLQKLQDYKITTFCAPPTMYRFMLQENMESYDLSSIKHYENAGEPLNPEVFRRIYELTGVKMREGFGQSESTVLIATFKWLEPRPGSMGKPAPLYDIDLVDAEGSSCNPGEEGEIVIRGLDNPSGLFQGYYQDDEYNRRVFQNGMYLTGDVAYKDDDGYYWFVGRNDDVIKCSGYRIGPFEVESALIEHPAVVECAVTGAPDELRGQVVKATIVLAAGHEPSDTLTKELQKHVMKVTAPYKYPRIVEYVSELPKTVSGKIKRKELREKDSK